MKKLMMVFLGGYLDKANIEVHDIQFVYTNRIDASLDELIKRWYGEKVHVDGYVELQYIDGYKITHQIESNLNLYLINYGGYHPDFLGEVHQHQLIAATSKEKAKAIAKSHIIDMDGMDHIDGIIDVFDNAGIRFGLEKGSYHFKDNISSNTYHKIIDHQI